MCGIVGYVGKNQAEPFLLEGLKRLEYRGYDSAGIALVKEKRIKTYRALGRVANLEEKLAESSGESAIGIAHTRWATHGKPSEKNAHPHRDCQGAIVVVHNGIIENYQELKEMLQKKGHVFRSQTDSEVIAHLLEEERKHEAGEFEAAFARVLSRLRGTYGLAVLAAAEPDALFVARMGSPLVLGVGEGEYWVASDVSAILAHTQRVIYLDDGERAVIRGTGYVVKSKRRIEKKEETRIEWSHTQAERGGYEHFMLKEIHEQPQVIADALRGRLLVEEGNAKLGGLREVERRLRDIERIIIVSCGTSYHAALVGEYMLEEYGGIPVEVEYASEFRYRKPLLGKKTAVIAISQSGETADTLAAVREAKNKGALTLGIVNTVGSTIARETDAGVYNHAGPEISVASTKAFTSQLVVLALLTLYLGRQREMSLVTGQRIARELQAIPGQMAKMLEQGKMLEKLAKKFKGKKNYLFLGRKYNYPVALEGALKIKEIAYVSAQGYPSGELKHGTIALVDRECLSIFIAPQDSVYDKSASGLEEIRAREGAALVLTTVGNKALEKKADALVYVPKTLEMLTPILSVIPLQLLAYYMSRVLGYDVDKPRNLAKSVTVE